MAKLRPWLLAAALALAMPASANPVDRWSGQIAEASARFGIPEAWIRRVMEAESGGRTIYRGQPVTSPAGAQGLMQVMPGTWRAMRAAHGLGADPYEPRDNILAGTAYLRAMYDRFGYPGLFAAYNAGPGRYAEHLARGRRLPAETLAYVSQVAGAAVGSPAPAERAVPVSPPSAPLMFAIRGGQPPSPAAEAPDSQSMQPALFFELRGARAD